MVNDITLAIVQKAGPNLYPASMALGLEKEADEEVGEEAGGGVCGAGSALAPAARGNRD
jgi:hypothetical protein